MALECVWHDLTMRIIERKMERSMNHSKAIVIHARTMENLNSMGNGRVVQNLIFKVPR